MIKKGMLFILSILPVFAVTDDSNFGTVESNNKFWRFSLVQIMCGATKFYFISWKRNQSGKVEFHFVEKITIKQCYMAQRNQVQKLVEKYKKYLTTIDKNQILVEREDLCYHIGNEQERIETSNNKINTYTTIVLTVTPIVMAIVDWQELWIISIFSKIILCIIAYSLENIIIYVYGYLKVGSYVRYGFSEIKIPESGKRKRKERFYKRNELLYSDWQQLRIDASIRVSYVLNLERWVAVVFGIAICLIILA